MSVEILAATTILEVAIVAWWIGWKLAGMWYDELRGPGS